jgi:iron complex outermembrane receptor protein
MLNTIHIAGGLMAGALWFLSIVFTLLFSGIGIASEASDNPSQDKIKFASKNSQAKDATKEELLLFYEEKDLVAATRRAIPLRKAPAIASVITAEEIKNMGARNLMDVLKMVTGIGVSINEFGRYIFEVRGIRTATSEKILVMIDGHRLNESYTGSALANVFNDLPVENIKQIEVVRGPGSALYGANGFVAVVNIITKDADDIGGIKTTAEGGSFDTKRFNVLGGKSFNDFQASGSFDYLNTDGPKLVIDRDRLSAAQPAVTRAPGRTDLNLEKTDVFLKLSYGDLTLKGQYVAKHRGAYVGNAFALTDENFIYYGHYWSELGYRHSFTDSLSSSLRLYFDQFEQDAKVELFPEGFVGPGGVFPDGMVGHALLKNRTLGSELQFEYEIFEGNNLIFGGLYENIRQFDVKNFANFNPNTLAPLAGGFQDITTWGNFNKDTRREIWAAFIQDEWEIRDNLNLTAGIRYDHYSDFGDTFNPRVGIVWDFMNNAELKLLYGQAFRAPNFLELYNANNPTVLGNPQLKPEEVTTYEAGIGYRFTGKLRLDMNYFYSKIDDMIIRDTSVAPARYANKGGAEVKGIEIELTGNYTPSNYWKLSYAYQEPKDSDTGRRLDSVPFQRAAASLNHGLSRYINSHIDILWTGPRMRTSNDTRSKMGSYATVDLTMIAKDIYKNLEIKGSVHNLFDKRYKDPDPSGLVSSDFPREGISALISVSYKF